MITTGASGIDDWDKSQDAGAKGDSKPDDGSDTFAAATMTTITTLSYSGKFTTTGNSDDEATLKASVAVSVLVCLT